MELSAIRKSISEMTEEELIAELSAIRMNRRVSKKPQAVVKKEQKSDIPTKTLLNNMSIEQAAALLAMMEGKK